MKINITARVVTSVINNDNQCAKYVVFNIDSERCSLILNLSIRGNC